MDKASMLYNRFKHTYLVGEGEEVVSAGFLRSLLEEKEREEARRAMRCHECVQVMSTTDGGGGGEEEQESAEAPTEEASQEGS